MIGRIISNYQITNELARGGTGAVYRGQHLHLSREVVIKSISLSAFSPSAAIQLKSRFRREAFILKQLDHPNIVRVYESFTGEDSCFLIMEHVPGLSLRDLLARQGKPTPSQAVFLFKQALTALEYAHGFSYVDESDLHHTGVIHRDIKPANLLLDSKGRLKVSDFGLAKVVGEPGVRTTNLRVETIEYMSPEQLRSAEIDRRSDLYSLGISFYEMLAGRLPFEPAGAFSDQEIRKTRSEVEPRPILELRPDLAPSLAAAIMRALRKSPFERFQSAIDFLDALRAYEQQPLIVASDLPRDGNRPSRPLTAPTENARLAVTDSLAGAVQGLPTRVISMAQQVQPEPISALSLAPALFSSIQQNTPRTRRAIIAGSVLLVLLLFAGNARNLLFSAGEQNEVSTEIESANETFAQNPVRGSSPAHRNSRGSISASSATAEMIAIKNARLFEKQEKYDEAIRVYEEYISRNPFAVDTRSIESRLSQLKMMQSSLITADSALVAGKYKLAVQQFGAVLRLNPDSQRARDGFSNALAKIPDQPERPAFPRQRIRIPPPITNPIAQESSSAETLPVVAEPLPVIRSSAPRILRKALKPNLSPVDQGPVPKPPDGETKP